MGSGREMGSRQPQFRRVKRVNVRFKISYYTQWGQNLMISGSDPLLGNWSVKPGQWMTPHHDGDSLTWLAQISVPDHFETNYKYCLVDEKLNLIKWESGGRRFLALPEGIPDGSTVDICDSWQDGSSPEVLLTRNALRRVLFGKSENDGKEQMADLSTPLDSRAFAESDSVVVRFKISCSRLENGQQVHISGDCVALGKWDNGVAVALHRSGGTVWQADVILKKDSFPIRYKYLLKNKSGEVVSEIGADREIGNDSNSRKHSAMIIVSDGYFRANPWRGAGVAIPVFSIRSSEDLGCGEFLDLKLVVDLAVKSGMRLVQLLPVNDTSVNGMWWDSYPYSSLSVFALHPLYLRVQALSKKLPQDIQEEIACLMKHLDQKQVDYKCTLAAKLAIAKKVFHVEKEEVLNSPTFIYYFEDNQAWLKPYAAFCFLRDLFGTADHSLWGKYSDFTTEKLERLTSSHSDYYDAIAFNYYVQFHLHTQLTEAADYARFNRVLLKGDLPIGVDRNSVDTWVNPTLFRMNTSTGAPPDYFDMNGQNWGFPTYNWEEMSKDNYAWWRARLSQMAKYFTAYRIDHILGFFRIWELPEHAETGLMGRFRPSIPLSKVELEQAGIWDFDRLSKPYVRCHLLQEKFGNRWVEVATKFFKEYQHLCYQFKEKYNTEKKIAAAVKARDDSSGWLIQEAEETMKGLFDLLHEVILMKDTEFPDMFYPRFGIESSASFMELDEYSKSVLRNFYYDYFYHRQEGLWRENALKTLPVLMNCSDMLACGEDLGMVPACVQPVLNELGLVGLRIQRMPSAPGQEFGIPADYDYMTVCAASCHDCSPMRAWWEEDDERRARFFRNVLGCNETPPVKCDRRVAHSILQQHLDSPSVWAIFPLQDFLALSEKYSQRPATEETINDPTNPRHYWCFRVHVSMETLLRDNDFLLTMRDMNVSSGRASISELPELPETFDVVEEVEDCSKLDMVVQQLARNQLSRTLSDSCHLLENGYISDNTLKGHLITN